MRLKIRKLSFGCFGSRQSGMKPRRGAGISINSTTWHVLQAVLWVFLPPRLKRTASGNTFFFIRPVVLGTYVDG